HIDTGAHPCQRITITKYWLMGRSVWDIAITLRGLMGQTLNRMMADRLLSRMALTSREIRISLSGPLWFRRFLNLCALVCWIYALNAMLSRSLTHRRVKPMGCSTLTLMEICIGRKLE